MFGDASTFSSIWEIDQEGRNDPGAFSRGTNLRDSSPMKNYLCIKQWCQNLRVWVPSSYHWTAWLAPWAGLYFRCKLTWVDEGRRQSPDTTMYPLLISFLFLGNVWSKGSISNEWYVTKIQIYYFLFNWENRKVINVIRPILCFCWAGTWTFLI